MTDPTPVVIIDGVDFVPASWLLATHPTIDQIVDALVTQWAGDNWQKHYSDAPTYLRVVVSDTFEDGEGESVQGFAVRLLRGDRP